MEALPYVPKNLMFLTSKMDQYHRNRFRLETVSSQTASPGSVVTVNLPESALIDMKSFRWHFKFNGISNTDATPLTVFSKMPADAQSLISRVEVYVNGVQVMSCNEYNSIYRLLKIQRGNPEKDQSIDRLLQNGHINTDNSSDVKDVMVVDWLGFLGETSTRFLPTDLLGQIQVRLTLAGNEVLVPKQDGVDVGAAFTGTGATVAQGISYNLSDMFFTIDSITVDPAYNMLMRDALQNKDLELNYKEYYNTTSDHGTNGAFVARFSVASQSVDKIYATIRNTNYQDVGAQAYELPSAAMGDRYVANYFRFRNFRDPTKKFEWQFSLNNVKHPQYYATQLEAAADISYANDKVGQSTSGTLVNSIEGFEDGKFVTPLRLNHPQGGCISRGEGCDVISGYNTKNINTSLTWEAKGMETSTQKVALIVVETTPTARIGMGRQMAVIY